MDVRALIEIPDLLFRNVVHIFAVFQSQVHLIDLVKSVFESLSYMLFGRSCLKNLQFLAPSAVEKIRHTDRSYDWITLTWNKPFHPNGKLLGYEVEYQPKVTTSVTTVTPKIQKVGADTRKSISRVIGRL